MVRTSRKCSGDPDQICAIPKRLDRMSAGQTGHFRGINGTRPWDGCDPKSGGVPPKFFMCIGFFSSQCLPMLRRLSRVDNASIATLFGTVEVSPPRRV